ncbi:hypothetical protein [Actinomadura parmotrematis]|uniref:Uncharacterized protein n=1 Tax=Actinomadura parmotrematis TaxID=2864039 RepID=A0ABS7FYL3_9ACTN|nr:hypothetical protein [Actinomadura parmotrematis]MBW8485522.1 hypothetical protein [Actinomadura parmotrematis]
MSIATFDTIRRLSSQRARQAPRDGDEHLVHLLMAHWALHTGRPLPAKSSSAMTEDELLDFWADPVLAGPAST